MYVYISKSSKNDDAHYEFMFSKTSTDKGPLCQIQ